MSTSAGENITYVNNNWFTKVRVSILKLHY